MNEIAGIGNHNTAEFWEYDTRLGRRWNLDPVVKPWINGYHAFSNSPLAKTDHLGNVDDWVNSKDKGTVYDSDVKSQKDAEKYYGKDAKRLEYDIEYESTEGGTFTLYNYGYYSVNGVKRSKPAPDQRFENNNWYERKSWIEKILYKGDALSDKYGSIIGYKYVEYNPVSNGIMNFGSGLLGKDMTIPKYEEINGYDGLSGERLSLGRRFTLGVNGASKLFGAGLGGATGLAEGLLLEGLYDYYETSNKSQIKINTSINIISFLKNVRKQPVKTIIETANFGVETTSDQLDKKLNDNE